MRSTLARCPWVVLGLALVASCKYDPNPPEGQQECYLGQCVDGYVCGYNQRCYTPAKLPVPPGTGGIVGRGGSTATGGVLGTGGMPGQGGATGKGGATGYGGVPGSGGLTGRGGSTGQGGVTGYGGATGQGGVSSTGGTTTPPNSGTVVAIANGQAQGAMTGYGWIALGSADTVTDPTCAAPVGPIMASIQCEETVWSNPNAYCVSGYLPAVTSSADYTTNWGIQVGVNCTPVKGGVLGQPFTSVSVSVGGSPQTGLRIVAHRKGDADATTYCAAMTPGTPVPFTSFNTACWDGTGTKLTADDVPNLNHIGVQVSSGPSAITITNLCLQGITFAK